MAIDARVVGTRMVNSECKLTLEKRDKATLAGQETLIIENPPNNPNDLEVFVGVELWGGSGCLMLGDSKIADRTGYVGILLVAHWRDLLKAYHGNRQ